MTGPRDLWLWMQAELGVCAAAWGAVACSCLLDQVSHTKPDHCQGVEFLQALGVSVVLRSSCLMLPQLWPRQAACAWVNLFPCKMSFHMIITIMTSKYRGLQIGPASRGRLRRQRVERRQGGEMLGQHFPYFWHPPGKRVWICVSHSGWMCWGIFISLSPTLPSAQTPLQCGALDFCLATIMEIWLHFSS